MPRDAYFAIADEAKKQGIAFDGHVPDAIRASEAIAAGQRTFEHLIGIFEASTPDEDAFLTRRYGAGKDPSANKSLAAFLDRYDPAREAIIVERLAANRVWQCPTLFWERGQWLVDVIDYLKDPDIAYTPRTWIEKKYPSIAESDSREHGYRRAGGAPAIRRSRAGHRPQACTRPACRFSPEPIRRPAST